MTIATNNTIAKIAAVVAGLGLVAMSFAYAAPAAKADAATDAQIAALMAQIEALKAGMSTSSSASVTFTRDLTTGSTGADVTALQTWLIGKGFAIPAGATGYFGAQTVAALAAYQAANGIAPAAGYFGPITRAKVNASAGTSTGGSTGGSTGSTGGLSGGEASLGNVDIRDGEDDEVEEGGSAQIAEFEFDVDDADVRIDRLDLTLENTGGSVSEDEPWEAFDTITLLTEDGDEIASEDVSDEDDWLENDPESGDPYIFRFTNLDYVVKEGDQAMIIVEIEAQNNVLDNNDTDTWSVGIDNPDGVRGIDGEGIQQYTDAGSDVTTFDLVQEGEDDDLTVRSSSDDPEASNLKVEDDGRSDWYTIFAFDLEADEDGGDIELNSGEIEVTTSGADVSEVLNDAVLVIDGEEIDDWSYGHGTTGATTTATLVFDIDGDVTINSGDRVTAELQAEFKALGGDFTSGDTITARVASGAFDGEGADDLTSDGAASGETHTLSNSVVEVSDVSSTTSRNEDGSAGVISFEFTIDATDEDTTFNESDVLYTVLGTDPTIADAELTLIDGDADEDAGDFTIEEGDNATFSLDVTLTTASSSDNGSYRVRLDSVAGVEVDETSGSIFLTYVAS